MEVFKKIFTLAVFFTFFGVASTTKAINKTHVYLTNNSSKPALISEILLTRSETTMNVNNEKIKEARIITPNEQALIFSINRDQGAYPMPQGSMQSPTTMITLTINDVPLKIYSYSRPMWISTLSIFYNDEKIPFKFQGEGIKIETKMKFGLYKDIYITLE